MTRKLVFAGVVLALFVSPLVVMAQSASGANTLPTASGGNTQPLPSGTQSMTVTNPLGVQSICGLIKAVLGALVQIGIPIAVLFLVWAGFKFVLARGNPEEIKKAKSNLFSVIIGIAIFLGAWLLAQLIANTINGLQQGSQSTINITACN